MDYTKKDRVDYTKKKEREKDDSKFFGMNSVKDGFALSSGMLELAHTDPGIW